MAQTSNIRTAIKTYFNSGLQYKQILHLLLVFHGTSISLRQLKRILRFYNLFRRNHHSPLTEVLSYIAKSLRGSKSCMGYRSLWLNMRQKGIFTTQENVRLALNGMDPEGVASRRKQVFKKRIYRNEGPNWAWHLDGYDKLKPFGFSIHACMDGYSRKVLWLDVSHTNKDPKIIASLYLNCVSSIQACPRLVIADRGSENATLAGIQRFLRRSHGDNKAGQRSFRYCRSTANQRIESYWSQLRRSCVNWWINLFKDLVDTGVLDISNTKGSQHRIQAWNPWPSVLHPRTEWWCWLCLPSQWRRLTSFTNCNAESRSIWLLKGWPEKNWRCDEGEEFTFANIKRECIEFVYWFSSGIWRKINIGLWHILTVTLLNVPIYWLLIVNKNFSSPQCKGVQLDAMTPALMKLP